MKKEQFILTKKEFLKRIKPLFRVGLTYETAVNSGIPAQIIERLKELHVCGDIRYSDLLWVSIHNNSKYPGLTIDNIRDDLWSFDNTPCGYTYSEEETKPKPNKFSKRIIKDEQPELRPRKAELNFDESESYLEQINDWFYSGFKNLFECNKVSPFLTFYLESLHIVCIQNVDENGETHIYDSHEVELAEIIWQDSSITGVFHNKDIALKNKDFMKLIDDLQSKSPFEPNIDDWEEIKSR